MAPERTPAKLFRSLQGGGGQEAQGPRSEGPLLQASQHSPDLESLAHAVTRRGTPENGSQRAFPSTFCAVAADARGGGQGGRPEPGCAPEELGHAAGALLRHAWFRESQPC